MSRITKYALSDLYEMSSEFHLQKNRLDMVHHLYL